MKRDLELVRELLLHLESRPNDAPAIPQMDGHAELEINYHLILLFEAGLIRAEPQLSQTGRVIRVLPFSLTWQGHEFLDTARDKTAWNTAKKQVTSKTGTVSFELLKALLIAYAKGQLGL
ncbi:DUF2513 domain-containing protein [Lysobacter sp. CFH 32150]|uniref:DUF2513 domain-containing protein n=1 Tax=Lysobacter sp. CFH 32150 TaxID=2927128 RepID=UPI001FA77353|nr:DUF2513 domain-containing protein [Lysobacter sp. CFH 32150]MCI4569499.1 DUF2513 domain-containing protein [Lysobacter sp. CFH 32150]